MKEINTGRDLAEAASTGLSMAMPPRSS